MRKAAAEVRRLMVEDAPDEEIARAQKRLNEIYDQFVERHGYLHEPRNMRRLFKDPEMPTLLALEEVHAEGRRCTRQVREVADVYGPAPSSRRRPSIGSRRRPMRWPSPLRQKGRLDVDYVSKLYGKSVEDVLHELGERAWATPDGGFELGEIYLSGDVAYETARRRGGGRG